MILLLMALLPLFDIPDRAGRSVFAIQIRVPALEAFFAQPDAVLQALEAGLASGVMGATAHGRQISYDARREFFPAGCRFRTRIVAG
jgi:hypothetical protein